MRIITILLLACLLLLSTPNALAQSGTEVVPPSEIDAETGEETAIDLSGLTLNPSAVGEKRETWTSLTDLFGVDILTASSASEREAAARAFLLDREARKEALFNSGRPEALEADEVIIQSVSLAYGLFLSETPIVPVQPAARTGLLPEGVSWILAVAAMLLLGVIGFLAATAWHKHKRTKREGG